MLAFYNMNKAICIELNFLTLTYYFVCYMLKHVKNNRNAIKYIQRSCFCMAVQPHSTMIFFVILSHQVGLRNQFILVQMQMLTCTSTAVYTRCCCYLSLLLDCLASAPVRTDPYMLTRQGTSPLEASSLFTEKPTAV